MSYKNQYSEFFDQKTFNASTTVSNTYTSPCIDDDEVQPFLYSEEEMQALAHSIEDARITEANSTIRPKAHYPVLNALATIQETEPPRDVLVEAYHPERITAAEFMTFLEENAEGFIANMENLRLDMPRYAEEWLAIMARWMELK